MVRFPLSRCFCLLVFLTTCSQGKTKSQSRPMRWVTKKEAIQYLTSDMTDMKGFREDQLNPILIERISGTPGNVQAREHIKKRMQDLGWTVEEDSFEDDTPYGKKMFVNLIATFNPRKPRKIVVACHYDSKDFRTKQKQSFIGAIDSAVPCAIMLETAKQLGCLLEKGPKISSSVNDLTLQYIFFDGEEAFVNWTETDSIYGARHLAKKWEANSQLSSIREFILLDLIGTKDTGFHNLFHSTSPLYEHLARIEDYLLEKKIMSERSKRIFSKQAVYREGGVEDDHIPFLEKGVEVLHLISTPFPSVWHKLEDNGDNLDFQFIDDFSRIFRVFISNLLHLVPENIGCRKKK